MASKKYSFLLGILSLVTFSAAQAQTSGSTTVYRGSGYDVNDSALIPVRRMDQQRDFLNRNYDYPAKPRNQWELGFGVGALNVSGDVRSKNFTNTLKGNAINTMAWNISLRKAWGYVISTRLQYMHGAATGFNWQGSQSHFLHTTNPYNNAYYNPATPLKAEVVANSYKTQVRELSLQMIGALNNIKFHRARNKMSTYGIFGVGGLMYATSIDMLDATGAKYNYDPIFTKAYTIVNATNSPLWINGYKSARKGINTDLINLFDGKFETAAERHDNRNFYGDKYTFRPVVTTGLGVQFRLGKRVSLGIEDKVSFTNDDLLDGQRWQEPRVNSGNGTFTQADMTRDFDNINYLSVNLGINLGAKSVAPLWWVNPMDFAYNELSTGRRTPKGGNSPCDVDTDGDGVSDCFDKCNDTPLGVAVDTKGCCLDTDGDGVCDFKDKQLITPTECQPVDADGIGKCPDPACCKDRPIDQKSCGGMNSGNVQFTAGSTKLSGAAMNQLNSLATQMRNNPSCKVLVAGNGTTKLEQQRSWMRVSSVINYMNSQGIDRERFCFEYGQSGMGNSVDYSVTAENANCGTPPPPPHPQLK
jgi:OmpA-OmpF porin, OOP family